MFNYLLFAKTDFSGKQSGVMVNFRGGNASDVFHMRRVKMPRALVSQKQFSWCIKTGQ